MTEGPGKPEHESKPPPNPGRPAMRSKPSPAAEPRVARVPLQRRRRIWLYLLVVIALLGVLIAWLTLL